MFIRHERSLKQFMKFYPVITTLVIIHIVLWLIIDFLHLPIGRTIYQYGVGWNLAVAAGEYWRFFTPIFLHGGLQHMLFNSFSLVLFGPALEQMLGKTKFLIGYLGAGIIGNIGTYLFQPLDYAHLGASGAIYGLFGIYIFMIVFRKHLIDQQSSQMIKMIVLIGVLMSLIGTNINLTAHFAGFAGGFLLAPIILTGVQPYNPFRVYETSYAAPDDSIQFDPNRWNKKSRIPKQVKNNWIWIVIGILAVIGLLSR